MNKEKLNNLIKLVENYTGKKVVLKESIDKDISNTKGFKAQTYSNGKTNYVTVDVLDEIPMPNEYKPYGRLWWCNNNGKLDIVTFTTEDHLYEVDSDVPMEELIEDQTSGLDSYEFIKQKAKDYGLKLDPSYFIESKLRTAIKLLENYTGKKVVLKEALSYLDVANNIFGAISTPRNWESKAKQLIRKFRLNDTQVSEVMDLLASNRFFGDEQLDESMMNLTEEECAKAIYEKAGKGKGWKKRAKKFMTPYGFAPAYMRGVYGILGGPGYYNNQDDDDDEENDYEGGDVDISGDFSLGEAVGDNNTPSIKMTTDEFKKNQDKVKQIVASGADIKLSDLKENIGDRDFGYPETVENNKDIYQHDTLEDFNISPEELMACFLKNTQIPVNMTNNAPEEVLLDNQQDLNEEVDAKLEIENSDVYKLMKKMMNDKKGDWKSVKTELEGAWNKVKQDKIRDLNNLKEKK